MINKKEKGFTLVELLAVIVILAIILVIAVPKVMSVIEDSKKATLESTAKMIASSAEKQKVQNTVLGNTGAITCDSVAKINNLDYESCSVDFDENTAKVTIKGKGKFNGLYVCNGTKTSAVASDEDCTDNSGVAYIKKLLEQAADENGLIVDDTDDKNIRYVGANPSNKVYFNCKDTYDGKTYGSEGYEYANACETWRIIGIFNVKTNISDTKGTNRIKIVRDAFTDRAGNELGMSWDSTRLTVNRMNSGMGINQWGESTYEEDNYSDSNYEGADLMQMLNGYYIGEEDTCMYCNLYGQETCTNDCSSDITPLSNNANNMIGTAVWSTRGIFWSNSNNDLISYTAKEMYEAEKTSELTGKECSRGNQYCTDVVKRTPTWEGKIGLIYPSDFGYACTDEACKNIAKFFGECGENNWMENGSIYYTIVSGGDYNRASRVWWVNDGTVGINDAISNYGVRPSTYLKCDIQIIGGNGDDKPYILGL